MTYQPLISVIIPVYNRSELVIETLASIRQQSYENWECIVVDDGSSDDTLIKLSAYSEIDTRFRIYRRPDNVIPGGNGSRNYGFKKSKGEFINWFDSDDLMNPFKLEKQIKALDKDHDMCISNVSYFTHKGAIKNKRFSILSEELLQDYIIKKIRIHTTAPLIRRTFLENHNLMFDESLKRAQEYDYFVKLLIHQPSVFTLDEVLCRIREHENSIGNKTYDASKEFSTFISRFRVLNQKDFKLNEEIEDVITSIIKSCYLKVLSNKDFNVGLKMWNKFFFSQNVDFFGKLMMSISYLSFLIFSRGEFFIKQWKKK